MASKLTKISSLLSYLLTNFFLITERSKIPVQYTTKSKPTFLKMVTNTFPKNPSTNMI